MSNTIVMNTLNGAVTEYDWALQSITAKHGGSVNGLYLLGGDKDVDQPIAASMTSGKALRGTSLKKLIDSVYLSMQGTGTAVLTVYRASDSFNYEFTVRPTGVSRCEVGRGLRENYAGYGFRNKAGAFFRIDRIEIKDLPVKTRRL